MNADLIARLREHSIKPGPQRDELLIEMGKLGTLGGPWPKLAQTIGAWNDLMVEAADALEHRPEAGAPEGWKLVPLKAWGPTAFDAAYKADLKWNQRTLSPRRYDVIYEAMVEAAPAPSGPKTP